MTILEKKRYTSVQIIHFLMRIENVIKENKKKAPGKDCINIKLIKHKGENKQMPYGTLVCLYFSVICLFHVLLILY